MRVSDQFFALLESFEGYKSCPYKDSVGVPTIGIGTTRYPTGVKVQMTDRCITHDTAVVYAKSFVAGTETDLEPYLPALNQNQYDSLIDFAYNLGSGALINSTLLRKARANSMDPTIRDEFMRWVNAGGKPLDGLVKRRKAEADLYFKPISNESESSSD